jgi:Holliday junction resolvase RusA-like endonuclease
VKTLRAFAATHLCRYLKEMEKMAKRRLTLKVRISPYVTPRNLWRTQIHALATQEAARQRVAYGERDRLQIDVRLYLDGPALLMHDVDNRLKDILDALQGRVGGRKRIRRLNPVIPNDSQVYRVTVEKLPAPKQSHGLGHLKVRKYVPSIKDRR